jgi:exodeoxyribonuclease VII large subunit
MFRGNAKNLKFRLEVGQLIIATGAITVYTPRGDYQLMCSKIEPSGEGALALAYEQLKQKLSQKGYFDEIHKKSIPKFINHIAIVTSSTGAAIEDMLKVANHRWKLIKITLIDTVVQGENSAKSIANNIMKADTLGADVIIVGRGGGSKEDLWGFNEEIVADSIYRAITPIVSAVGHEIDYMISDFVADMRAPTPSAAMQMILPDINEYLMLLDDIKDMYDKEYLRVINNKENQLNHLIDGFKRNSIEAKLTNYEKEIKEIKERFNSTIEYKFATIQQSIPQLKNALTNQMQSVLLKKDNELVLMQSSLNANKPESKMKRGYAQVIKDNKPISLETIRANDEFVLQDDEKIVQAKALKTRKVKK